MPCGREIRLWRVKSLRRWGIYFISLDAKRQISQFAEQIISPWAKRTISLFVWIKRFEYCTRSVSRGAGLRWRPLHEVQKHRPSRQARPSPSAPAMKKALANASVFFNEINPFRDLWNALRAWNTPAACEIAAAVRIYFISLDAKHQFSQFTQWIISRRARRDISLYESPLRRLRCGGEDFAEFQTECLQMRALGSFSSISHTLENIRISVYYINSLYALSDGKGILLLW